MHGPMPIAARGGGLADLRREHNDFWFDKRRTILTRRTSLIIDPPDGKLPPLTPEAAKKTVAPADDFGAQMDLRTEVSANVASSLAPAGRRSLPCPAASTSSSLGTSGSFRLSRV